MIAAAKSKTARREGMLVWAFHDAMDAYESLRRCEPLRPDYPNGWRGWFQYVNDYHNWAICLEDQRRIVVYLEEILEG